MRTMRSTTDKTALSIYHKTSVDDVKLHLNGHYNSIVNGDI